MAAKSNQSCPDSIILTCCTCNENCFYICDSIKCYCALASTSENWYCDKCKIESLDDVQTTKNDESTSTKPKQEINLSANFSLTRLSEAEIVKERKQFIDTLLTDALHGSAVIDDKEDEIKHDKEPQASTSASSPNTKTADNKNESDKGRTVFLKCSPTKTRDVLSNWVHVPLPEIPLDDIISNYTRPSEAELDRLRKMIPGSTMIKLDCPKCKERRYRDDLPLYLRLDREGSNGAIPVMRSNYAVKCGCYSSPDPEPMIIHHVTQEENTELEPLETISVKATYSSITRGFKVMSTSEVDSPQSKSDDERKMQPQNSPTKQGNLMDKENINTINSPERKGSPKEEEITQPEDSSGNNSN